MDLVQSMKTEFFREPRKSKFDWIFVGFGILTIALSIMGALVDDAQGALFSVDPEFFLLGLAFIMMGGAELLPADQGRLSALLRFAALGAFLSYGAYWFGLMTA